MMGHDCNKYIISGGEFIRDFEEMYKNVDDPWDQEKTYSEDLMLNLSFFLLSSSVKLKNPNVLDVGCANGYHSLSLFKAYPGAKYTGTDISPTVIDRAIKKRNNDNLILLVDDIRKYNDNFCNKFDLIFSSKTLYYVAPEIDDAIENISKYLIAGGFLTVTYNLTKDAFSNKWLTPVLLREKLLSKGFIDIHFLELDRLKYEQLTIGIFQKK